MNKATTLTFRDYSLYLFLILSIVIIDQILKLSVFYNMTPGSAGEISIIGDFFKLHFVQNPGMAFGIKWGTEYGKLILSVLRLSITIVLIWYFIKSLRSGSPKLLLISLALIIAGAIGNGIDSTFYGIFLDNAPVDSPMKFLHGQVVDMFYVDIWKGRVSESIPMIGGRYLSLWPIFNIADSVVSVGVVMILVFQGRIFEQKDENKTEEMDHKTEGEEGSGISAVTENGYPQ